MTVITTPGPMVLVSESEQVHSGHHYVPTPVPTPPHGQVFSVSLVSDEAEAESRWRMLALLARVREMALPPNVAGSLPLTSVEVSEFNAAVYYQYELGAIADQDASG